MDYNQLRVLPTPETREYLSNLMSGSPIDIDLDSFSVELMTTEDFAKPAPDNVYRATSLSLKVWYDTYLQRSSLILSLSSPDLVVRCMELHKQGIAREFFNHYYPYMVIKEAMPALSRNYKTFILSTANALCSNERLLEFSSEYVSRVALTHIPNYEYQMAQLSEQANRTRF